MDRADRVWRTNLMFRHCDLVRVRVVCVCCACGVQVDRADRVWRRLKKKKLTNISSAVIVDSTNVKGKCGPIAPLPYPPTLYPHALPNTFVHCQPPSSFSRLPHGSPPCTAKPHPAPVPPCTAKPCTSTAKHALAS